MTYQLTTSETIIRHNDDGTNSFIPNDPNNRDRVEYEEWLAADPDNEPEPAE